MQLNATVWVNCSIGYESISGEALGLCGIDPEDDSRGRWVSPTAISKAQVPWQPLRCGLRQSYCPVIQAAFFCLLFFSLNLFKHLQISLKSLWKAFLFHLFLLLGL